MCRGNASGFHDRSTPVLYCLRMRWRAGARWSTGSGPDTMTPEEIVAKRDAGHHMNENDYVPASLDRSSTNGAAIRGREQQLIESNGGAQSTGGTSGNAINGVSAKNKKGAFYRRNGEMWRNGVSRQILTKSVSHQPPFAPAPSKMEARQGGR